jgi:hypothetical protein
MASPCGCVTLGSVRRTRVAQSTRTRRAPPLRRRDGRRWLTRFWPARSTADANTTAGAGFGASRNANTHRCARHHTIRGNHGMCISAKANARFAVRLVPNWLFVFGRSTQTALVISDSLVELTCEEVQDAAVQVDTTERAPVIRVPRRTLGLVQHLDQGAVRLIASVRQGDAK